MGLHHTNAELFCPLCEEKLKQAHAELHRWFYDMKEKFPQLHISCSYRGEKEQNQAVSQGKSKAKYPASAHNKTNEKGEPEARALDVFELKDGKACFDSDFYVKLWKNSKQDFCMIWGGNFKSLGDANHFQLV